MALSEKYGYLLIILVILSIVGVIDASSLPLATAEPEVSLSPTRGQVDEIVNIEGTGFVPLTSIEILFDGVAVSTNPSSVRTNLSGAFNAEFTIPSSTTGNVIVTAREKVLGSSASTEFMVLNDAPVAEDTAVSADEDVPLEIALNATDVNDDSLVFAIVQNPEQGTLTDLDEESGVVTYIPNADYNGDDSFSFKVNDGSEDSNIAEASISISPVNDPPSTEDQELSINENEQGDITLTGSDPDGDDLTFSITEEPVSGTLTGDFPNIVYRPSTGFSGNDSFSFIANDGEADSNISQMSITVHPVNGIPSVRDTSVRTNEDESVMVTLVADDADSDSLTFTIVSQPSHGTLGEIEPLNSISATVVYTPQADYNGTDSFTFAAGDGEEHSDVATADITINAVNDAPIANDQSLTANAGQPIRITLTGTDADDDSLTFSIVEDVEHGTLSPVVSATNESATVNYTPNRDYSGPDSFMFRVSDGAQYSETAAVAISIHTQSNSGGSSGSSSDSSGSSSEVETRPDSNADTPSQAEQTINDDISVQDALEETVQDNSGGTATQENEGSFLPDEVPGQAAVQSLATDTVENTPFMSGPLAWLIPGAIIGVVSVIALLGYRERRKRGEEGLKKILTGSEQADVRKENTYENHRKIHSIQDRIAFMVNMNRIYHILDDERGKAAREYVLDVEYNKRQSSRIEYENNRSAIKDQFEQIGSILRSNPLLMESFFESFGDLTIKIWWAIKQDVSLDRRRGRHWESLEWLGSEAEKYWSTRSKTSSQTP